MTKVRVVNLSDRATLFDLHAKFAAYGPVTSALIMTDASTGGAERVGFIEMTFQAHAAAAIAALDGADLKGGKMSVGRALPLTDGGSRGNLLQGWDVARRRDGVLE